MFSWSLLLFLKLEITVSFFLTLDEKKEKTVEKNNTFNINSLI